MAPPKFSVLLPTRDRLDLAKSAIETVLRQTYQDWELVVADNYSKDDVLSFVRSLDDPRIIYTRSDRPITVTNNWNRALDASTGRHVVMLGDDDGLTPGYFERVLSVMDDLQYPDFIHHGAYQFTYPGVIEKAPKSKLADVTLNSVLLQNSPRPRILPGEMAQNAGRKALDFWSNFGFNMQHFVFSRSFVDRMLKFGPFFQGPFPDFYAANAAMLLADRIGVIAEPLVIIGVTSKSYGYFHNNSKEKDGIALLQAGQAPVKEASEAIRKALLPGTNMLNSWLISVSRIPEKFPERKDLKVDVQRYRSLQILYNIEQYYLESNPEVNLSELWRLLNIREKMLFIYLRAWMLMLPRKAGEKRSKWASRPRRKHFPQSVKPKVKPPAPVVGKYGTLLEVYLDLAASTEVQSKPKLLVS